MHGIYSFSDVYKDIINGTEKLDYASKDFTDSSETFLALEDNTTVLGLRLDYNTSLSQEKISKIVGSCTSLEVLSLRGLTQLTSIDFVENMPNLKELDLYGCTNLNSLTILGTLLSNGEQNLKTLILSNENVDLSDIQNVINNLEKYSTSYSFLNSWGGNGGFVATKGVWENLEGLTEITNIVSIAITVRGYWSGDYVDLSGCTSLTSIKVNYVGVKLILPDSVTTCSFGVESVLSDVQFASGSELSSISIGNDETKYTNDCLETWFENLGVCTELSSITITSTNGKPVATALSSIESLSSCSSLRTLSITGLINLTDISGLEQLTQLTSLTIYNCTSLSDISCLAPTYDDEENLVSGLANLTTLNLGYCNISEISALEGMTALTSLTLTSNAVYNLYALRNMTNLVTLSLASNSIYDTDYYTAEDGTKKSFNNLDIIATLNGYKLKNIYLADNPIEDYSPISGLSWTTYSV